MNNTSLNNSIRNIIFGLLRYGITIICPFFIRTLLIYKLGLEYAGITSLFTSVLHVLNLSDLGFSTAIVYALYKPIADKDDVLICAYMNLFKKIYRVCGLTILFLGMICCPFIKKIINGTYPENINLYIIFIILLLNTSISYLFSGYRSALLIANQRNDLESKGQIIANLIVYFLQIIFLILGSSYYFYVISMLIGTVANNFYIAKFSKKYFPNICATGDISQQEKKKLFSNVGALFGHQLDVVIITSADNIIISAYINLAMVTYYNNYFYIISSLLSVLITIANSFVASIGNSIVTYSKEKNFREFKLFCHILGIINIFCTVLMIELYQDFMTIWMGKDSLFPTPTVILLVLSFYVRQMRRASLIYKNALGLWKGDFLKPYIAAATNLVLNIILVNTIGINGVIISTIISLICIEIPWETIILFRDYFKTGMLDYLKIQFEHLVKTIIISALLYICLRWMIANTIFAFSMKVLLSVILALIFIIALFFKNEGFLALINYAKRKLIKEERRNE